MKLWILLFVLQVDGLFSIQTLPWNNYYPTSAYQQGNIRPGQPLYNYQPGVPLPTNIQQLVPQTGYNPGFQPNVIQGIPINNLQGAQSAFQPQAIGVQQGGIPINNLQGAQSAFQPQTIGLQQGGIPINNLQTFQQGFQQQPFGVQQGGVPLTNQQFLPQSQIGYSPGPGPITFPR